MLPKSIEDSRCLPQDKDHKILKKKKQEKTIEVVRGST